MAPNDVLFSDKVPKQEKVLIWVFDQIKTMTDLVKTEIEKQTMKNAYHLVGGI